MGVLLHFSFLHFLHEVICDEESFNVPANELRLGDLRHEKFHYWSTLGEKSYCILFPCTHYKKRSLMRNRSRSLLVSIFTAWSAWFLSLLKAAFHQGGVWLLELVLFCHHQVRKTVACWQPVKNRGELVLGAEKKRKSAI